MSSFKSALRPDKRAERFFTSSCARLLLLTDLRTSKLVDYKIWLPSSNSSSTCWKSETSAKLWSFLYIPLISFTKEWHSPSMCHTKNPTAVTPSYLANSTSERWFSLNSLNLLLSANMASFEVVVVVLELVTMPASLGVLEGLGGATEVVDGLASRPWFCSVPVLLKTADGIKGLPLPTDVRVENNGAHLNGHSPWQPNMVQGICKVRAGNKTMIPKTTEDKLSHLLLGKRITTDEEFTTTSSQDRFPIRHKE